MLRWWKFADLVIHVNFTFYNKEKSQGVNIKIPFEFRLFYGIDMLYNEQKCKIVKVADAVFLSKQLKITVNG